jgi:hypothetical protein
VAFELEFEKTQNLIQLITICSSQNASILVIMKECERLNTAFIDTRYPVHWPVDYTKDKAINMKKDIEKIEDTIIGLLSEGGFI